MRIHITDQKTFDYGFDVVKAPTNENELVLVLEEFIAMIKAPKLEEKDIL